RERHQVAIAETVSDRGGLTEQIVCAGSIAGRQPLQSKGKEEVALLDAVMMRVHELLASPRHPGARPRPITVVHQTRRQPERASCRPVYGASIEKRLVRTCPDVGALRDPAREERSGR